MMKYFRYELKKNSIALLFFTLMSTVIYVISVMIDSRSGDNRNTYTYFPVMLLFLFCTVVPIMVFSFKMNPRCVDEFYSLPIRREKLYLVHSLVGLCLVFIPYTVAYWAGFLAIALTHSFNIVMYLPLFFASVPLGVLLFGTNAFAFTRANKVFDGFVFMGLYSCVLLFPVLYCAFLFGAFDSGIFAWTTYGPINVTFSAFDDLIRGGNYFSSNGLLWAGIIVMALAGCACWFGLFFSQRFEKAENAGQVSTSWFGYKTLLPFYLCFLTAVMPLDVLLIGYYFAMLIVVFVGNVIYRRTFMLPLRDIIVLIGALVIGLAMSGILRAVVF